MTGWREDRRATTIDQLDDLLCETGLDEIVEMTVRPLGDGRFRARSAHGSVTWRADHHDDPPQIIETVGANPFESTDETALNDLAAQDGDTFPNRRTNAYPNAFSSVTQYFAAPHAADLVAMPTARHNQGTAGDHGTLAVVQARAPFLAWGRGVRSAGRVPGSTPTSSIAPTVLALLGADEVPHATDGAGRDRRGALLARQDGAVCVDVLDGTVADHVVVVLLDGLNATRLAGSIDDGECPRLRAVESSGTHLRDGCLAAMPTATLANHTTMTTGVLPGFSGVVNNTWWDRDTDIVPDLLDLVETFRVSSYLAPGVETIFEAVARTRPGSFNAALFEYVDAGADFSSFAFVRAGTPPAFPGAEDLHDVTAWAIERSGTYRWMTTVDHVSVTQAEALWNGSLGNPAPTLTFVNLSLIDEAGHEAGPHAPLTRAAVTDSDARIGRLIDAVERAGLTDRTAFLVVGDHGMEASGLDRKLRLPDIVAAERLDVRCLDQAYFYAI